MSTYAQLVSITETRRIIKEVIETVTKAVCSTMGPNGRLVMISGGQMTKTTKDGVTVARCIKFPDEFSELVNRVLTEPAIKTDKDCGDGTTTTILYTSQLYSVFEEFSEFRDQKFIEQLVQEIIVELTKLSIRVEVDDPRLLDVAMTSANQDVELAAIVTDLYKNSNGSFPEIELKEGQTFEDRVEQAQGRVLKTFFANPGFGKGGNGGEWELTKGFTPLIVDARLDGFSDQQVADAINGFLNTNPIVSFPIVLIARSIEQQTCSQLAALVSRTRGLGDLGHMPWLIAMNTSAGGAIGSLELQDLAVMLDAPIVSSFQDLATTHKEYEPGQGGMELVLGSSRSLLRKTRPVDEARIEVQAKSIEEALKAYTLTERFSLRAKFQERRIRNLRGQLVTIFVGGETNSEVKERLDRYEDVVKAVKSALENGILPGGGIAMRRATYTVIQSYLNKGVEAVDAISPNADKIIRAIQKVGEAQHRHLFGEVGTLQLITAIDMNVVNLATGEVGTPEMLGVYDTAFASITALKGGLQTAKLLANTETLITGNKLGAVVLG